MIVARAKIGYMKVAARISLYRRQILVDSRRSLNLGPDLPQCSAASVASLFGDSGCRFQSLKLFTALIAHWELPFMVRFTTSTATNVPVLPNGFYASEETISKGWWATSRTEVEFLAASQAIRAGQWRHGQANSEGKQLAVRKVGLPCSSLAAENFCANQGTPGESVFVEQSDVAQNQGASPPSFPRDTLSH